MNMKIDKQKLKVLFELTDMSFEEKYLEIEEYKDKGDKTLSGANFCFEAEEAFNQGLLKDFEIKAVIPKTNTIKLIKIAEYANGYSYDKDESDAGYMEIIIVYKAFCDLGEIFIACQNNITFPVLKRYFITDGFSELLLIPYISSAYVWANYNFKELMNTLPYPVDEFYINEKIDLELYKNALFSLQMNGLDTDENRCLIRIDDHSFLPRRIINIIDLKRINYINSLLFKENKIKV